MKHVTSILLIQACLCLLAGAARAADFPPVTDEERAITAVPGEPNAPAVVLSKKGEFLMAGYGLANGNLASSLRVQVRLKVLTEEGKSNGEISIWHSDTHRLLGFKGRTVLPDGRVFPVSADAKFVRKTSRSRKTFTTAVAFPSVQVGVEELAEVSAALETGPPPAPARPDSSPPASAGRGSGRPRPGSAGAGPSITLVWTPAARPSEPWNDSRTRPTANSPGARPRPARAVAPPAPGHAWPSPWPSSGVASAGPGATSRH